MIARSDSDPGVRYGDLELVLAYPVACDRDQAALGVNLIALVNRLVRICCTFP